jgi:anhydro-N-acetylmuramic acid kinase
VHTLRSLLDKSERIVAGIMSGTSLDGIDVAVARLSGSGTGLRLELLAATHTPYTAPLRRMLLANSEPDSSSVRELCQLGALLGRLYSTAVTGALEEAGLAPDALDLVGSHGQTVHHIPVPEPLADAGDVASTLQIGDAATLANRLRVPVVSDFRAADVALGGQGAPLVPYFDFACFASPDETRLLLNLGGIANVTVLPRGGALDDVYAFDTGPANMVLDALARRLFDQDFDLDGAHAAAGTPDETLLAELLEDPFYHRPPPKSTGREAFGRPFVDRLMQSGLAPDDVMATAAALTARSVRMAYDRFIAPHHEADVLIASGGGVRNPELMRLLKDLFGPIAVRSCADDGIDPDAKEALCFAVLAHEWLNGVPTNLPAVTGASRRTLLGKLTLPG